MSRASSISMVKTPRGFFDGLHGLRCAFLQVPLYGFLHKLFLNLSNICYVLSFEVGLRVQPLSFKGSVFLGWKVLAS